MDIKDFIKESTNSFEKDMLPTLIEKNCNIRNEINPNEDIFEVIAKVIGLESTNAIDNANYIALKHLEAYHMWLTEHYELVPKK